MTSLNVKEMFLFFLESLFLGWGEVGIITPQVQSVCLLAQG